MDVFSKSEYSTEGCTINRTLGKDQIMICVKCGSEVADAPFCSQCGARQLRSVPDSHGSKKRGNGQGCVYKLPNGKYQAIVTRGYILDENGKRRLRRRTKVFDKKKDAILALPELMHERPSETVRLWSFKEVYDKWIPTHKAGKSTIGNYSAAVKYFESLYFIPFADIDIDDLQECIDDCPRGRRTKENMRACAGLMYKFAIPRHATRDNLNLSEYLSVDGDSAAHRNSFDEGQICQIINAAQGGTVPYAEEIMCMIFLGFRPSEFLDLTSENYDEKRKCLTGGSKTPAGKGRTVTVSPMILPFVEKRASQDGALFQNQEGKRWGLKQFTEKAFYPALESIGIDNPIVTIGGGLKRHKYTPHSCRHTFATLMKKVEGAEKDKLELMGHTSGEMLRYYQDVGVEDLRNITDNLWKS